MRTRKRQNAPETFHVVVHLFELIVIRGVGDGGEMKNGVELFVTELLAPIKLR